MRRVTAIVLALAATAALAGMPTVTLADVPRMRLAGSSFFVLVILVVALGIMGLWNLLRRDFQRMPKLTYTRALAFTVLLGLCFNVVLLMIAGTRELMTPGAWEKRGATYKLPKGKLPFYCNGAGS
jgi:hypothetical protein